MNSLRLVFITKAHTVVAGSWVNDPGIKIPEHCTGVAWYYEEQSGPEN
jgi:hypothetical protein